MRSLNCYRQKCKLV